MLQLPRGERTRNKTARRYEPVMNFFHSRSDQRTEEVGRGGGTGAKGCTGAMRGIGGMGADRVAGTVGPDDAPRT